MIDPTGPRSRRSSGKALPILLLALAAAGIVGLLVWLRYGRAPAAANVPVAVKPEKFEPDASAVPRRVRFVDVTDEAGIRFRHTSGARGKKLLPETMGSGCAFLDFDRDGDQDLLLVNSAPWPGEDPGGPPPTQCLYRNDGKGKFEDVTAPAGLAVTFYGMGAAIGDYDADGWDDILFTTVGGERLFRNEGGKAFRETTAAAGIVHEGPHTWSTGAAFLDYDRDGNLDLFICRYVEWSPEIDLAQEFQITGIGRAYGPPQNFAGSFCKLLRNTGGKFEDVSEKAGIQVKNSLTGKPMAKALGVSAQDLDDDGWVDLAVANDTVQNFLFQNQRDGTFVEVGIEHGFAFDAAGGTRGAMGIDVASLDGKGTKAIVVGNFANEITALYKSDKPLLLPFSDDAIAEGIGNPSRKYMKFGVFFFDFDLDGRLDIFEANGHLESEIETVQTEQTHAQPAQLFWSCGPGAARGYLSLGSEHVGPDLFQPMVGRGCAYADIDADGDLDVVLTANGGRSRLFRNDGGSESSWIRVRLEGAGGNRNAFGARVEVHAGGTARTAQLSSGRSYLSQSEQVLTFGLGNYVEVEKVRIWWPGDSQPVEYAQPSSRKVLEVKR